MQDRFRFVSVLKTGHGAGWEEPEQDGHDDKDEDCQSGHGWRLEAIQDGAGYGFQDYLARRSWVGAVGIIGAVGGSSIRPHGGVCCEVNDGIAMSAYPCGQRRVCRISCGVKARGRGRKNGAQRHRPASRTAGV